MQMSVKELIYAEIDKIEEENLDELYQVIQRFAQVKSTGRKTGVLSKLKRIKIQAPIDFAANLDLYLSGEKQLDSDPDLR
jgi:DNA polymerase/3'-5' exonuclease PolX